ncbi:MAG: undecaprenyl-diphosphate phosphatase, partial [Dehalococcoidia bacterium]
GFERWGRRRDQLAAGLLLGALPMALAELLPAPSRTRAPADVPAITVLLMGVAQAAALAPGVSRSGATIAVGMVAGLDRDSATRLSFLLAVPISLAALVRSLPELKRLLRRTGIAPLAAGIVASFLTGLLGIQLMRRLLGAGGLWPFVLYRCVLAAALSLSGPDEPGKSKNTRLTPSPQG